MASSIIQGIRDTPGAFRITRDGPTVFEFEFDYRLPRPGSHEFRDVVVGITSPVVGEDLALSGCELRIKDAVTDADCEVPDFWGGDRTDLTKSIQSMIDVYDIPKIEVKPGTHANPVLIEAKKVLGGLACEVAGVMMNAYVAAWGPAGMTDMIAMHQAFFSKVLAEMNQINDRAKTECQQIPQQQ